MPCLIRKLRTFVVLSKFESILSFRGRFEQAGQNRSNPNPLHPPHLYHRCAGHGGQSFWRSSAPPTRGITAAPGCHLAVSSATRTLVRHPALLSNISCRIAKGLTFGGAHRYDLLSARFTDPPSTGCG
jgi:hypothetical protein